MNSICGFILSELGLMYLFGLAYLERNASGTADVVSGLQSFRRGLRGGHIRKYCFRSALPVKN